LQICSGARRRYAQASRTLPDCTIVLAGNAGITRR